MTGKNIKGIIVEIGGDTSALENSLKKVNASSASLNKELGKINSLLKLDPKSTELTTQKQELLKKSIKETEEKLNTLKEAQSKYIEAGGDLNTEAYRDLQREIISTENKLKKLQTESSNWTNAGRSIEEFGNKVNGISDKINNLGTKLTTRLTLPIAGFATASVKAFNEVDEGADTVIKKTGATGETAKELEKVYKKVSTSVVGDFNDIGNSVGEINTRFGFTGDILEEASEKFLKFAKVNDVDVNTAVQKVSRYMGDAGIKSSEYASILDQLTSVAQASGISIDNLAEMLTKYGAPMRALGLETQESIAIFAGWEKAGVNTEIAFSGMKKAIGTWGKEGKDATKEFKKTLEEIKKCPDIASATTKAIEVFGQKAGPDLADAIKGGRFEYSNFLDIVKKSEGTLENTYSGVVDEADEAQLAIKGVKVQLAEVGQEALKTAIPAFKKLLNGASDLIKKYNSLSDSEKQSVNNMIVFVAAIGPATKILGTLGNGIGTAIKGIGTFTQAIGVMKTGVASGVTSVDALAKIMTGLTSPLGIGTMAVTALVATMAIAIKESEKESKEAFSNIGNSANDFVTGINNAKSHLESFNSTLFASSEEQENLKKQMDDVQKGITQICKTASDERRGYTQQEITQLDQYFAKLRELKNREIQIQGEIATAITQQATTNAQSFQGSLEEYKVQSQEWIKTATEQQASTIKLIEEGTIEEVALLNQRYSTEEERQTEAYQNEYNRIMEQKQAKIDAANDEVAKVGEAYTNGYLERMKKDNSFFEYIQNSDSQMEQEKNRHKDALIEAENATNTGTVNAQWLTQEENRKHKNVMAKIWQEMYKNMSENQEEQLGVLLAEAANTEMYGGKISDETQEIVDKVIESYDSMPTETREAMKNAMTPMLEEMQKKQPSLFAKASGIAEGILSRLRKSFDIHSPSRKTRKIFNQAMEGAEIGVTDEEDNLYKQLEKISQNVLERFSITNKNMQTKLPKIYDFGNLQGNLKNQIIDKTQTIFTTPQINFNVKEMTEENLERCFIYINKKFGSHY